MTFFDIYVTLLTRNRKEKGAESMITIRNFTEKDAEAMAEVVRVTLKVSNSKDYSEAVIMENIRSHSAEHLIENAKGGHFFVACDDKTIIGCGGIAGYWGSLTESFVMTVFVLPAYQKRGIGRMLMERIESDEIFLRANRIEIAASITACDFYRKLGYTYKNGITTPDEGGCIRLEKFR